MSASDGPFLNSDGLVFYFDASNTKNSWKGRPVINRFAIPTPDSSSNVNFEVNGTGIFKRVTSGRYGTYDITPDDVVYRYDLGGLGCHYHGNDVTITAGQKATWSFDYYVDPSVTGYPSTNYLVNFEGVIGGAIGDPTPSLIGVWKRLSFTGTAGSTGLCRMLIYPGACGDRLATGGFVLFKNPQVEFDAPGDNPTPFVAGTRSNTQAIRDLTGNNTITANSLTYNADGSFSFNGTSDFFNIGKNCNQLGLTSYATFDVWIYPTSTAAMYGISDWTGDGITVRTNNNTSADFYIYPNNNRITYNYSFNPNVWYNLVGVADGSMMYLYLNGERVGSAALANPIGNSLAPLKIGARGDIAAGTFGVGKAGAVKIYNRALSAGEINQNFNALRSRYGI